MRRETTPFGVKDIASLEPGEYEVEFVREQPRVVGHGRGHDSAAADAMADAQLKLPCCILRVVETGEEVEDTSRVTARAAIGQRFAATVEKGKPYARFRAR